MTGKTFDLKKTVREAAKLLPERYNEFDSVIEKGGKQNIVTHYDKEVQTFLVSRLKEYFPNASFLGEEGLHSGGDEADVMFVIDPIDGTTNFVQDCKFSCISVAMLHEGVTVEAAVYNPYLDEMFYAKKGGGAWLNDEQIHIEDKPLGESIIGFSNCPYDEGLTDISFELGKRVFSRCLDFRRMGSAALEICYSACGRYQLYCEMILYPWDYAAADLVVEEAGGTITDLEGMPPEFDRRYPIVAGCPTAAREVVEIYKELTDGKTIDNVNTKLF